MEYTTGITRIRTALQKPLPGVKAQHKMAPEGRKTTEEFLLLRKDYRLSSVMMLLYPDEQGLLQTVFIERPVSGSVHSGQIAFPGGKVEAGEVPLTAATRETEEEIGVPAASIRVLGTLSQLFIPASNFLVFPHIGTVSNTPLFTPNPEEVKSLLQTPLGFLLELEPGRGTFQTSYGRLSAPFYNLGGHVMWGATAMIVSEFREMMAESGK